MKSHNAFILVCVMTTAAFSLAACGSGDTASDNSPAAPTRAAPTEAEKQAILATLPSPYDVADLENGRRVFARCRSCHTLTPNGPNMTGPNLHGVFGSTVGTKEKFRYSNALKDADFTWDAQKLDNWLLRPRDFLPGNKMSFVGISAEQDRRDVIAYLKVETGYEPK